MGNIVSWIQAKTIPAGKRRPMARVKAPRAHRRMLPALGDTKSPAAQWIGGVHKTIVRPLGDVWLRSLILAAAMIMLGSIKQAGVIRMRQRPKGHSPRIWWRFKRLLVRVIIIGQSIRMMRVALTSSVWAVVAWATAVATAAPATLCAASEIRKKQ